MREIVGDEDGLGSRSYITEARPDFILEAVESH